MLKFNTRRWLNIFATLAVFCAIIFSANTPQIDKRSFWLIFWQYFFFGIAPVTLFISAVQSKIRGIALVYDRVGDAEKVSDYGTFSINVTRYSPKTVTGEDIPMSRLILSAISVFIILSAFSDTIYHRYSSQNIMKLEQNEEYIKHAVKHTIGEHFGGGIVIAVRDQGAHGLIIETNTDWYEQPFYPDIKKILSDPKNHSDEGKEYGDWRIPNGSEMDDIYYSNLKNRNVVLKGGKYLAATKIKRDGKEFEKYHQTNEGGVFPEGKVHLIMVRDF